MFRSRRWHIPLFTLLPSLVSDWDEVLWLILSNFELENTHEGCGFLLLLKLLVRIADVLKQPFHKTIYVRGSLVCQLTFHCRVVLKASATVNVAANMTIPMKKDLVLANQSDKQQFISCWVQNWRRATAKLYHAPGEADLLIVQRAVQSATTSRTVLVEDTDLNVLLCYFISLYYHYLFLCPEPKKSPTKLRIWNIRATREKLGQDTCNYILNPPYLVYSWAWNNITSL